MVLDKLRWFSWLWYKIVKDVYKDNIGYYELKQFLEEKFPKANIELTDVYKKGCDYETLKSLAHLCPVKLRKYQKEVHDCEDFSRQFDGWFALFFPRLAVGRVHVHTRTGKHALNCAVYKTKSGRLNFTYIEPQSGKVFHTNYKPYLIIL